MYIKCLKIYFIVMDYVFNPLSLKYKAQTQLLLMGVATKGGLPAQT